MRYSRKGSVMEIVRYEGSQEWSALYVDGVLDRVGDHYLIEERIQKLLGVEVIPSDDFMLGGNKRSSVAQTLIEAQEYGAKESERLEVRDARIAELEEELEHLRQQ